MTDVGVAETGPGAGADADAGEGGGSGSRRRRYTFSLVYIMRNEERNMRRSLGMPAVQAFIRAGGEVVVFDTGSTDRTKEIAVELGCRVVEGGTHFAFHLSKRNAKQINQRFCIKGEPDIVTEGERIFNFALARNAAGKACANDLVMQIDANDLLEALAFDIIQDRLDQDPDPPTRLEYNHYFNLDAGKQIISRFYDRRKDEWKGMTHECLTWNGTWYNKWVVTDEIIRVRYMRDESKTRNYFGGMAIDLMRDPNDPRWYHYLGREMYYTQRWHSAIALLENQGRMLHAYAPERSASLFTAGWCWHELAWIERRKADQLDKVLGSENKRQKHLELEREYDDNAVIDYFKALQVDAGRREGWLGIADIFRKRDMFQAAAGFAEAALSIPHTSVLSEFPMYYRDNPHDVLAWAYYHLDRKPEAKAHCVRALTYVPHHPRLLAWRDGIFKDVPDIQLPRRCRDDP